MICIFFRVADDKTNHKNKGKKEDTLEERYETNISKIIETEGTKKVRMLLPIKTQNGSIERRLIQENDTDNENATHETHDAENSKMESNFPVRFHQN